MSDNINTDTVARGPVPWRTLTVSGSGRSTGLLLASMDIAPSLSFHSRRFDAVASAKLELGERARRRNRSLLGRVVVWVWVDLAAARTSHRHEVVILLPAKCAALHEYRASE